MQRATTSASNVHRRALCPGSERLEAGLPEEDSVQSKEGTLLHSFMSNPELDRSVLKPNQQDLLRIAEETKQFVIGRVCEQFSIPDNEPFEDGSNKELFVYGEKVTIPGHCDDWRRYPRLKLIVVLDYKFGFKIVEAAFANYQLRAYAVGAADEWIDEADRVVVAIVQPRLPYSERCTMAAYEGADIEPARDELLAILAAARLENAPLIAGESQCRYCRARTFCPALKAKIDSGLSIVAVGDDGTVAKRQAEAAELLAKCSDDQLDRVLVAIQLADFVKEPARDEGRRRVEAGQLTNWTLGKASEIRGIVDPARAFSLLVLRGDLTKDEALACSKPSITKIEEKIREKKKCTWKDARSTVEETLAPVLERESKKQSLTRKKE